MVGSGKGIKNAFPMRNGKTITHSVRHKVAKVPRFSNATYNKMAKAGGNVRFSKSAYSEAHRLTCDLIREASRKVCDHVAFNKRQTIMVEDIEHIFPEIFGEILDVSSHFKKRKNASLGHINIIQRTKLKTEADLKKRKKRARPSDSLDTSNNI